jgi:hypothetical protein
MNIHYFKDLNRSINALYYDVDSRDSIQTDETKAYYLRETRKSSARYLPGKLEVKYLGMYPVIADSTSGYMGQDWKGNIAFNGYSVRADGFQSNWYPVLFVNGSLPVKAKSANLVSNVPREMSLFEKGIPTKAF